MAEGEEAVEYDEDTATPGTETGYTDQDDGTTGGTEYEGKSEYSMLLGEEVEVKEEKKKKPMTWMEHCIESQKWKCDDLSLWNLFTHTFAADTEQREKADIFKNRRPANLRKFPLVQSEDDLATHHKCLPLSAFQVQGQVPLPNKIDRSQMIRIWKNMRSNLPVHSSKSDTAVESEVVKSASQEKWPTMWPCTTRDMATELLERRRKKKKRIRKDLFPCDSAEVHDPFEDPEKDYSGRKELGHARIPPLCPLPAKEMQVDRAAGEQPGLVDGDYIIFELPSKARGTRTYADVCLRGLKGMHLPELGVLRMRKKTWKFCFYQAIIALLAKTQLRYKYAGSVNIDYIYDHAWMLYTHMGMINVKEKQRLDDIIVYNYKYSIEVELIQEINDVPIVEDIPWDYEERNLQQKLMLERRELMNVKLEIGSEKITDEQRAPVHRGIKQIEEFFDKLKPRYRNCIFRTTRFCLAFWKDNLFWYLYNPYRCDEFGYWNDEGYACIMKFCSKDSLKRHLMILLLRAYVYTIPKPTKEEPLKPEGTEETEAEKPEAEKPEAETAEAEKPEAEKPEAETAEAETAEAEKPEAEEPAAESPEAEKPETDQPEAEAPAEEPPADAEQPGEGEKEGEEEEETTEDDKEENFTVQIYHVVHHCCQIYNLKLLQRGAPKPPKRYVKRKTIDDCPFDPLDTRDPCTIEQEESDLKESIEKPTWLKLYKITWSKAMSLPQRRKRKEEAGAGKMRWHQYVVEESNKLFSLWGELHITDGMFEKENRGMQTYACYVVCAGMTRIMAPEYWSSKTLDVIVMCGDRYYTHSKLEAEIKATRYEYSHVNCWNRYLKSHFKIGETIFEAKVLPAICGRLYAKAGKYLWQSLEQMFLKYNFGILTCESSCLGVFKFCGAYYMCDVNSMGPPLFVYGEGAVYLLRATYFHKFITALILTIGSPECSQFALNPIEILKVVELGPSAFPGGKPEKRERGKRVTKVECPYDEEKKKQMRKWKHKRAESARIIDKVCCKGGT